MEKVFTTEYTEVVIGRLSAANNMSFIPECVYRAYRVKRKTGFPIETFGND
jgi:hypothetical protein